MSEATAPARVRRAKLTAVRGGAEPQPSVDALVAEAQAHEQQGHRDQAREAYERALHALSSEQDGCRASSLLRWIARIHQMGGDSAAALDCLEAALAVAEAWGDESAAGHATNIQAVVHWQQGDLDEAERLYLLARGCALRAGDAKLAAMTAQNLGVIANIRGEFDEARRHYENALAEYRSLGLVRDVCVALNNLGMLHTDQQRWEDAGRMFDEAVQISDTVGDMGARALLDVNLAEMWVARGEFARAQQSVRHALDLAASTGDASSIGEATKIQGVIARDTGDLTEAEAQFRRADEIAMARQDLLLQAEIARERADLHRRQGRNADVLQCLNRAHRLFTQLRARRDLADVGRRIGRLEDEFVLVARRWGESIEAKDRYTQGHCVRVADLACAVAARAGLDEKALFWFRIGALLHDVGKLVIPEEVLNKPGKLTDEEWGLMKSHTTAGVEMLAGIEFPWDVRPIVLSHHERWDGRGYPEGLAGEAIPLTARILCVADVYDALTSVRSYKRALSHEEAMAILRKDTGTMFDPQVFAWFEEVIPAWAVREPAAPGAAEAAQPAAAPPVDGTASAAALPTPAASPAASPSGPLATPAAAPAAAPPAAPPATSFATPAMSVPALGGTPARAMLALGGGDAELEAAGRADVDDLTGMPLRRTFRETAEKVLEARRTTERPVSLLVIDVDHFKLVNDTFGHLQGDDVLRLVADQLRFNTRPSDFVARYAGDEFVALLPGTRLDEANAIAERLRGAVAAMRCPRRDAPEDGVAVTLSIGVAAAPGHGASLDPLFAAADGALYAAKRRGRNAVAAANTAGGAGDRPLLLDCFVGRAAERQRLTRLFAGAARGEAGVVAIVGEAGVGKSTLVRQLAPEVGLRNGSLLVGRCLEADVRAPYGPWADVIAGAHAAGMVPERMWRELPRLLPALGEPAAGSTGSRYDLLAELEEFLTLATTARPLLVVLDDMQWADAATWDALEYLVPRLDRQRLLVCLTIRSEDMRGEGVDRRRRLSRHERFSELLLERLSRAELAQWLKSALGGAVPTPELLDHVAAFTEGNPLFAVQTLRTLVEDGRLAFEDGRWRFSQTAGASVPVAVGDLLERRLARLADRTREILAVAAVLGREFDADVLIAASGRSDDEVVEAIDAGLAATVLRAADDRGTRFAFAHALLADVIRRGTSPLRLRRAHDRVARILEERRADSPAEIALHYDRAGRSDRAYHNALLAGARASAVYAHEEAAGFFDMADRHASTLAESADAQWHLAQVDEAVGRYAEAERRCDIVLSSYAAGAAERGLTPAVRRARERLRLNLGRPAREILMACETLLAEARDAGNRVELVSLLTMLSHVHTRLGDSATAERFARDAVYAAEHSGDDLLLADAVMRLGSSLLGARPADAVPYYRRALDLFTRLGDRRGQLRCHINVGIACDRAGNHPAAEVSYVTALELGREIMARDLAGLASLNLGVLLMKSGRWPETRERFEEALQLFAAVNNEPNRLGALYNLANLARERGDAAGAVELYGATVSLAAKLGQLDVRVGALAGGGLAELNISNTRAAREKLAAASELLAGRREWWFQGRELIEALRIRLVATDGDLDQAATSFQDALVRAEMHDHYAAVWLAAECAGSLRSGGAGVTATLERLTVHARALGYQPVLDRLLAVGAGAVRPTLRVAS